MSDSLLTAVPGSFTPAAFAAMSTDSRVGVFRSHSR